MWDMLTNWSGSFAATGSTPSTVTNPYTEDFTNWVDPYAVPWSNAFVGLTGGLGGVHRTVGTNLEFFEANHLDYAGPTSTTEKVAVWWQYFTIQGVPMGGPTWSRTWNMTWAGSAKSYTFTLDADKMFGGYAVQVRAWAFGFLTILVSIGVSFILLNGLSGMRTEG